MSAAGRRRWEPSRLRSTEFWASAPHIVARLSQVRNIVLGSQITLNDAFEEGQLLRECLVIYVDAALDRNGRAGCGLAVFIRGRAVYTESFGFSHLGGSGQLETHVLPCSPRLPPARRPYQRVLRRPGCA